MSPAIFINTHREPLSGLPEADPRVAKFHQSLPHYSPTPLVSLPGIAKELGVRHVLLKNESSRLGLPAFKILGASWATARAVTKRLGLSQHDGVALESLGIAAQGAGLTLYAATDGNHGRAVARMAKYLGIKANIYVPSMVDEEAKGNIRSEGASVAVIDGDYDRTVLETSLAAEKHLDGKGVLITDTALEFGDQTARWIVEGYQTMFDEIEEQVVQITGSQNITHVLTPVGSGSLAQAAVTHFERTPRIDKPQVMSVEPEEASCLKQSLESGKMSTVTTGYTICTGMCCGTLSANVWPVLQKGVRAAIAIDDVEVDEAIRELERYEVHAGPCGAATLAGLRRLINADVLPVGSDSVVVMLCTEGKRGYELRH